MKTGDNFGDYRLIRKLGEGGMAEVWLAEDARIQHKVAVKVLHAQFARDHKIRKRLGIEAQALACLKHPNIVGIHQYIERDDDVALVMEYVEGKNLDEWVRRETGPLPEEQLRSVFLQMLDCIGYAHQQGIVHRDIKPSNFMVSTDGTVKVLDFGIAKVRDEGEKLTRTGMHMGTISYMSPEQVNVAPLDHLSDIYSLGVTLFFLATGRGVYEGEESEFKVQGKIVHEPLPAASGFYPGIPAYVEHVIAQATAKQKEERFQGCSEMRETFEGRRMSKMAKHEVENIHLPRKSFWNARAAKMTIAVLAVLVLGVTAFEWKVAYEHGAEREQMRQDSIAREDSLHEATETKRRIFVEDSLRTDKARKDSLDKVKPIETAFGLDMEMILVQGGTFTMGRTSEQGMDDNWGEKPAHKVTLSSYYIGAKEVTQSQWQAVMGANPSSHISCDHCPVEMVHYEECRTFIRKLNEQSGKHYRLPTEAEWEYAARGGNNSLGYKYAGSNNLNDVAWYRDNATQSHIVAQKLPNELGIYDMSGNVLEWCADWYDRGYYKNSPPENPKGPALGSFRVMRCGAWNFPTEECRVSNRNWAGPGGRGVNIGFRLARDCP